MWLTCLKIEVLNLNSATLVALSRSIASYHSRLF